jgi:NADH-quinone oxidoreductase subunit H
VILAETGVSVFSSLFENFWVVLLLKTIAVMGFFLVVPLGVGYVEHKGLAHMQARLGPMEAGAFHGWAQLVADGVKFIQKEDVVPAAADRNVFSLAPAVAMIPYIAILVVLPISDSWFAENLDVGIFFVLAMSSVSVIGVMMAGWSSANKFSLIGALRAAAQLIAYELPLVIAAAAVVMQAGTLSMVGIVEAQQDLWFIIPQLPGFLIFMIAAFAELQRPPFDMPIADSEIIFGAYTEYTGLRFALFLLAEYAGIVVLSALTTVLFLGGWRGPFDDALFGAVGVAWTLLKTLVLAFLVIWLRVAYPRLREDQLQRFAWQGLVPVALAQLALTGVVAVVLS